MDEVNLLADRDLQVSGRAKRGELHGIEGGDMAVGAGVEGAGVGDGDVQAGPVRQREHLDAGLGRGLDGTDAHAFLLKLPDKVLEGESCWMLVRKRLPCGPGSRASPRRMVCSANWWRHSGGTIGNSWKMRPAAESCSRRSNTMTLGAMMRALSARSVAPSSRRRRALQAMSKAMT